MTVRKTLLSAVSALALGLAAPAAMAADTNTQTNTDVFGRNGGASDADILQRGSSSNGTAIINQEDVDDANGAGSRALIDQEGSGANHAFINQNEENVVAKIDQGGSEGGEVDIRQDELSDTKGGGSLVEVDQVGADSATVDVFQEAYNSSVQVDSLADDGNVNVVQYGSNNDTDVTQRTNKNMSAAPENADVRQLGTNNTATIVQ